jgi:hypothetical protein
MISIRSLLIASILGAVALSIPILLDTPIGGGLTLSGLLFGPLLDLASVFRTQPSPPPSPAWAAVTRLMNFLGGPSIIVTYLAIGVLVTLLLARERLVMVGNAIADSMAASVSATFMSTLLIVSFDIVVVPYLIPYLIPYLRQVYLRSLLQSDARTFAYLSEMTDEGWLEFELLLCLGRLWTGFCFGTLLSGIGSSLTGFWMRGKGKPAMPRAAE